MFHKFISPMTTKLSFTNASDFQEKTSPVSTISFYSNTPTIENVQRTFPTSDSWKPQIYFDYPTPNTYVERTSLTLDHAQDTFHLTDSPVPSVPFAPAKYTSTVNNDSQALLIKSPEYCPKTPVYVTKAHDFPQKFANESPIFYPSSSTTTISGDHDFSIDSPEYFPKDLDTFHQVSNDSSEFYISSPISISTTNELKRSTLTEKRGNSIESSSSVERRKFNRIHNDDEHEDKENSVRDSFKLNSTSNSVHEGTSAYIQTVNSDFDITTGANQTPTISQHSNPSNDRTKGLVRRSTRLAAKPPLNYRV